MRSLGSERVKCLEKQLLFYVQASFNDGGTVASELVRSAPKQAVRVRALLGDIVLCSKARHLTLTVPFSCQVYK